MGAVSFGVYVGRGSNLAKVRLALRISSETAGWFTDLVILICKRITLKEISTRKEVISVRKGWLKPCAGVASLINPFRVRFSGGLLLSAVFLCLVRS